MADAAKHVSFNAGALAAELKGLSSVIKTRKSVAFAYGFMFAFVIFTVFLAFNPAPNSSAPWFTNIFSTSTSAAATTSDSYRSQISSFFSHFFPNSSFSPSSEQLQQVHNFTSLSPETGDRRSNNTVSTPQNAIKPSSNNSTSQSPTTSKEVLDSKNNTFQSPQISKVDTSSKNLTTGGESFVQNATVSSPNQSTTVGYKQQVFASNGTENKDSSVNDQALNSNHTAISATKPPAAPKQAPTSPEKSGSPEKEGSEKGQKGVAQKQVLGNDTASLSKKQSDGKEQGNGSDSGMSAKEGAENLIRSLMDCDLFDGEWVRDDSYPLYKPGSCSFIDEQFSCIRNGRLDRDYQKYKWKPKGCTLPRLNGGHMLELIRGKRLVFVGDSLNRNMWESLVCILRNAAKNPKNVYEAHGRSYFRGEAVYSFIFKDYSCTVEFFVSPFLVREWEVSEKDGSKKETLRLDLVGKSSDQYKGADIIIFNTGHWWTHEKTSKGKDYYQEGSHVYGELNVLEAFRKALTTWARWVDANVNPTKSMVFFRGYSASHFSGGQWNSGGACDSEIEPIKNETYLKPYPPKMLVLEKVLRGMKTHVTYLNITRLTDFRKDGHPSIYRKQNISPAERKSPLRFQDCSHWCLPGVPDAWNELLYAELLVKENKMRQHQPRA